MKRFVTMAGVSTGLIVAVSLGAAFMMSGASHSTAVHVPLPEAE